MFKAEGGRGTSMGLANPKLDLPSSSFITKCFCRVQRREVEFGEESLLETNPMAERHRMKLQNVGV